jgi:glycogen operon protein
VHGPWNPARGHLCCPEKLLLDPCGKAVVGDVEWDDTLFPYDKKSPNASPKPGDTAPFVPKSVVVDTSYDWGNDRPPQTPLADSIIYEIHVKGFSKRHPDIPAELRGTYAGLAHPASIEHLKRLGVTAVELMPIGQFFHRRRLVAMGQRNYWGYDPAGFFAPHNEYASDRSPGGAVTEFKHMVRALHGAGIEVILDVVFNHTVEGDERGPILCFKGIDNGAYYRLLDGEGLRYVDDTGTDNTLNTEHPHVREMILNSLRYWAQEMHIDGFRFDLAPVLLREGGGVNMQSPFFTSVREDPVLSNVKLIAEPWDLGHEGYRVGQFPNGWSEWNDRYRDDVRDFWAGRDGAVDRFMRRFTGSPDVYRDSGRPPQASVNFVTCHDGFPLHDLVSREKKRNTANGEENRDGADDNHSWNCGVEGVTDDEAINNLRARQKRNILATLFLSQGVPMMLGGDEIGRSQGGNNNAYCQDNEISWLDWTHADRELTGFVASLTSLRKKHAVFRSSEWLSVDGEPPRLTWYHADGHPAGESDFAGSTPRPLQVLVLGSDDAADFVVMFNPTPDDVVFNLPETHGDEPWFAILDTASNVPPNETDPAEVPGSVVVAAHAMVVAGRQR